MTIFECLFNYAHQFADPEDKWTELPYHLPFKTVLGVWYQKGAPCLLIQEEDDGYGVLKMLRMAAYTPSDLPKEDRIVMVSADEVLPKVRERAEQYMPGVELVYLRDASPSPKQPLNHECALPKKVFDMMMGIEVEEPEAAPAVEPTVEPSVEPEIEPLEPAPEPEPVAEPESESLPEPEPTPDPEPYFDHKPSPAPASRSDNRHTETERGLFDDFFSAYAARCSEGGEISIRRSAWSGELVVDKSESDVSELYQMGLLIIALAFGLCVWFMIHFEILFDFSLVMGCLGAVILLWSAFMLWFRYRVNQAKKML